MHLSKVENAPRAKPARIFNFSIDQNTPERKDYIAFSVAWMSALLRPQRGLTSMASAIRCNVSISAFGQARFMTGKPFDTG